MKIVIKVGTQSILSAQGTPLEETMRTLIEQIIYLKQEGCKVVFVSSGAVGCGRSMARQHLGAEYGTSLGEKQVLASLGQHELMHIYAKICSQYPYITSQILLTRQDFYTRQHYLNIARLIKEILRHPPIIPIINENDSVAIEELMFTDNDELAGLIAAQINADKLIILSNVEGVYTGQPGEAEATLIPIINPQVAWPSISGACSTLGRGGMLSKLNTAKKMSKLGILTHIASINQPQVIVRLTQGESLGTTILAYKGKSNIKKWVAYGSPIGKITINQRLCTLLKESCRAMSILPIGITSSEGDFAKNDVIEILGPTQESLGMGIARYSSQKLMAFLGLKNKPAFIHYDYLYIF